jgi:glycosyltransferase involved in cell wall biosynthesis
MEIKMLKVSVLTITNINRLKFISLLKQCIINQDYPIYEWVIVDSNKNRPIKNEVDVLRQDLNCNIVYHLSKEKFLGAWRNESNDAATGDILVTMDDDDYYFPTYVSEMVNKLKSKKYLIAGCDKMLFYDVEYGKAYQWKGFRWMHSTNNCMGYWKEFTKERRYSNDVKIGEEKDFTNDFNIPMAQIDPFKATIQISHNNNTCSKKEIILNNKHRFSRTIDELDKSLEELMGKEVAQRYLDFFKTINFETTSKYDIVCFCGKTIGKQVEEAKMDDLNELLSLTEEWVKRGKSVAIYYGPFSKTHVTSEGKKVNILPGVKFNPCLKFKNLIYWRTRGSFPYCAWKVNAERSFVDLQEHNPQVYTFYYTDGDHINYWMVKSSLHDKLIKLCISPETNTQIIPNGISVKKTSNVKRQGNRFCFNHPYSNGLNRILKSIWPKIKSKLNNAEFHIYYTPGSETEIRKSMSELFSQSGVFEHEITSHSMIVEEKSKAVFDLYYAEAVAEVTGDTIKESMVLGCIPILSNANIYGEHEGLKLQWLEDNDTNNTLIANNICSLARNRREQAVIRSKMDKAPNLLSWDVVAEKWLSLMV